jgi:CheY-like chemotaxis protein
MSSQPASTVLVVEDEALVRLPIAEYLRDRGYHVLEAENAAEAIALVETAAVDVVFSDVRMPGRMDGFALARWLREHHPDVPVLLTSGWTGLDTAASQGVKVIPKPYSQAQVVQRIETLLR